MNLFLVPISLLLLFFSKRWLTVEISRFIRKFGGGHRATIIVWSIIFLPGTVIHELSHFFFAILTGARTGKIEIFPEFLEEEWEEEGKGQNVTLGYVQTQRLNPLQGFLVGTAPFLVGIVLMAWLAQLLRANYDLGQYLNVFILGYLFFTITNSFFPSWSDIKQTIPLVIICGVIILIFWILGFQIFLQPNAGFISLMDTVSTTVLISVIINLLIIAIFFLLNKTFRV